MMAVIPPGGPRRDPNGRDGKDDGEF